MEPQLSLSKLQQQESKQQEESNLVPLLSPLAVFHSSSRLLCPLERIPLPLPRHILRPPSQGVKIPTPRFLPIRREHPRLPSSRHSWLSLLCVNICNRYHQSSRHSRSKIPAHQTFQF